MNQVLKDMMVRQKLSYDAGEYYLIMHDPFRRLYCFSPSTRKEVESQRLKLDPKSRFTVIQGGKSEFFKTHASTIAKLILIKGGKKAA